MEDLFVYAVATGMAYVTKKVTQKGIATLKAKGVKVPVWMERVAPSMVGGAMALGARNEMSQASTGGE